MEKAVEAFFLWKPLLQADLDSLFSRDDVDLAQDELLKATLQSKIHLKFPVHYGSRRLFFKKIVHYLEQKDVEALEPFYYASVTQAHEAATFYKSYFRLGQYMCSLAETKEFVSQGTTGLKTWPGAEFLLDHLAKTLENLKEVPTILELGSGVGLTGIALLKMNLVKKFIFTDHHEEVLTTLTRNLEENEIETERYQVKCLDWEENTDFDASDYDIVIGSDIVFDERCIPSLVSSLKALLSEGQSAIIANVERNRVTKEAFESQLRDCHLEYQVSCRGEMLLYKIN